MLFNGKDIRDTDPGIALRDNNPVAWVDYPANQAIANLNRETFLICAVNCRLKF